MSKKQRRKIAQQNGAKAAGTKSPAGIQKSSKNALKHGLLCQTLVLANESPTKFNELLQSYIDRFQPTDNVEMGFVNEMVAARWRQQRMWMIQTAGMDLEMNRQEDQIEEDLIFCTDQTRISLAFDGLAKLDNTLELQLRYETSYSRMHDRAMKALQRLRESSKPPEPKPEPIEPFEPSPAAPSVEAPFESPVESDVSTVPVTCKPLEASKQNLRNDPNPLPFP